jgi:hypothetical protein
MEREIQIAGQWLIFMLIFGMVLSMAGITGTVLGYAHLDPSQAIPHPILHPLARLMFTVGPIVLFSGAVLLMCSIYGMRTHQSTPTATMAPIEYGRPNRASDKAMDEADAREEAPGMSSGWRKSY